MGNLRAEHLQIRIETVARERVSLLERLGDALLTKLPETPPNPPAGTICSYQPFFGIIKNGPPLTDVTADFTKGLESLPDICLIWREKQETYLKELLCRAGCSEDLSLAINAFTCTDCSEKPRFGFNSRQDVVPVLHYPYFALHQCFYSHCKIGNASVTPWTNKRIKVAGKAHHAICKKIIEMCGLDAGTATVQDMDAADAFLTCEKCVQYTGGENRRKLHKVMRWRSAMNHGHNTAWARATDADLISSARAVEKSSLKSALAGPSSFVCVHCNVAQSSASARSEHLSSEHGITGDAVDHYRRSLKDRKLNSQVFLVAEAVVSGGS
ncbi:hypothetical protein BDZ89DRAFT_1139036 [Hymenopellis radicata]|nr:hypothetical protein BDZ89DRAFT_1139036 [Hymenopellis radicata]